MSMEFVWRLVGMVVFAMIGIRSLAFFNPDSPEESARIVTALTLAGAALGLLIAPYLTIRPFQIARVKIKQMPAVQLIAGVIGLAIGLAISALMLPSLAGLPDPYGSYVPVIVSVALGYAGAAIMIMRQHDIFNVIGARLSGGSGSLLNFSTKSSEDVVLLDTSVIIDGRIADISQTGFIRSTMLVPGFVLAELQYIADSADPLRRNRGRRGLELLKRLQSDSKTPVQITDLDVEGVKGADDKLLMLAKQLNCPIVTNDFNLNSVAKLHSIVVLNINDLANAVKTVILPGEDINVKIIQEGKEAGQGVGYLGDGTMVVVENGKNRIDRNVDITVTKVLQTSAGRMIFAKMTDNN